jgi:NAD(P)-dependent dehydrogenase (short-subunit alcohol dehydrogenase family)
LTDEFAGRSALVTGGASGIGQAITRKLVGRGAQVLFCDLNEAAGKALAAELSAGGGTVRFLPCDVTDEASVERLIASAQEPTGRLDIAINNVGGYGAGDLPTTRIHDSDLEAWNRTVTLNLTSCFLCLKHELTPMRAQGKGAIVNVASLAAMRWSDGSCPSYAAAKAGVIRLTEYAAVAYAADGVRVNVIAPGLTATQGIMEAFSEEQRNAMAKATQPIGRMIDPSETADAVLWAASDRSSGVTGLTVPVDGGWAAT